MGPSILTSKIQSHKRPHDHRFKRLLYFAGYNRNVVVCCLMIIKIWNWFCVLAVMANGLPQSCQLLSWLSIVIIIRKVYRSYKTFYSRLSKQQKIENTPQYFHNYQNTVVQYWTPSQLVSMISFSKSWSCETKMCEWMLRKHSYDPDLVYNYNSRGDGLLSHTAWWLSLLAWPASLVSLSIVSLLFFFAGE